MDPIEEITPLNLEENANGGNDSFSNDSVTSNSHNNNNNNATVTRVFMGTNDEKNSIRDGNIDYKTRMKRHTEIENEISTGDQVRRPPEGFSSKNSRQSFSPAGNQFQETDGKRHLTEETGNGTFAAPTNTSGLAVTAHDRPPKLSSRITFNPETNSDCQLLPTVIAIQELKQQNQQLLEALRKTQKTHATEKKRFYEILFGIDKALSSLPIRLEKIRVRNQKNLSIINSSRFHSGDGNENSVDQSGCESSPSDESLALSSQDSHTYLSSRMKCLLQKMDQLNDLVQAIQEGDASPIELLVNSELYAISLLKKEIKSTKKQIEENKTDTETVTSFEESQKDAAEDYSSKANNSFSNELNKASNFKIFENHMMLQEEALNLLTRKIKETEEALLKEVEAKEGLKRENEALAKEIFRLKSTGEEPKGEKFLKTEKLKPEPEATATRPYRLIKELKTKLEEKEKSLIAWKSKYSRLESTAANKNVLLEGEKKKNSELDAAVKNLKAQNKSMNTHMSYLQFLNEQLRDQSEILKHQVEILANEKIEREIQSASRNSKIGEQIDHLRGILKSQEEKMQEAEKEAENRVKETKAQYQRELEEVKSKLKKHQDRNDEFAQTFKELLTIISRFSASRELKKMSNPSYDRIREILHITSSDLEVLFNVYAKSSAEKEVENLYEEFKSIVKGEESEFSETLSIWFFEVIMEKLLRRGSGGKNHDLVKI